MKNLTLIFIPVALLLASCSVEEEPELVLSSMQINLISVQDFPGTDNGNNWDFWTSHPDIYVALKLNGVRFYTSEYYDECINANTYNYDSDLPLYLEDASLEHSIELWDYDSTSDDEYMGGYYFTPSDYEGQNTITLQNSTSEIVIVLEVEWNYKEI